MDTQWRLDRVVRAWDYVRVEGFALRGEDARPARVTLRDCTGAPLLDGTVGHAVEGAPQLGPAGFVAAGLVDPDLRAWTCSLEVAFADGGGPPLELPLDGNATWTAAEAALIERFRGLVAAHPAPRMLEIGGRARSGVLHRDLVGPVAEYVGVDILPGEGVDVVADVHAMAAALGEERFDFACSYDVFEHLAFPWKVVLELNRVLVPGGHALIIAPQSCGMHDLPWDYFRFSDAAYRSLFCAEAGFEVVDVVRGSPMHLFPFFSVGEEWHDAHRAAGFFAVAVIARKTGPTALRWDADPARIPDAPYPA